MVSAVPIMPIANIMLLQIFTACKNERQQFSHKRISNHWSIYIYTIEYIF